MLVSCGVLNISCMFGLIVVYMRSYSLFEPVCWCCLFFQAEDGIRDLVRSRGLGDVYKRQDLFVALVEAALVLVGPLGVHVMRGVRCIQGQVHDCLLYTSDAADERSSVDLGGRRIIKKKKTSHHDVDTYNE